MSIGSSNKTVLGIFGIFYMAITGNFECFAYILNFETNFLKNENLFFKKIEL